MGVVKNALDKIRALKEPHADRRLKESDRVQARQLSPELAEARILADRIVNALIDPVYRQGQKGAFHRVKVGGVVYKIAPLEFYNSRGVVPRLSLSLMDCQLQEVVRR